MSSCGKESGHGADVGVKDEGGLNVGKKRNGEEEGPKIQKSRRRGGASAANQEIVELS